MHYYMIVETAELYGVRLIKFVGRSFRQYDIVGQLCLSEARLPGGNQFNVKFDAPCPMTNALRLEHLFI